MEYVDLEKNELRLNVQQRKRKSFNRRSSILKSPSRNVPLDNEPTAKIDGDTTGRPSKSRRVSFADALTQVKEFAKYSPHKPDAVVSHEDGFDQQSVQAHPDAQHITGLDKLLTGTLCTDDVNHLPQVIGDLESPPVKKKDISAFLQELKSGLSSQQSTTNSESLKSVSPLKIFQSNDDICEESPSKRSPIKDMIEYIQRNTTDKPSPKSFGEIYVPEAQFPKMYIKGGYNASDKQDFDAVINTYFNKFSPNPSPTRNTINSRKKGLSESTGSKILPSDYPSQRLIPPEWFSQSTSQMFDGQKAFKRHVPVDNKENVYSSQPRSNFREFPDKQTNLNNQMISNGSGLPNTIRSQLIDTSNKENCLNPANVTKLFSDEEVDADMEMTSCYGNILETRIPKQTDMTLKFSGEEVHADMEMTTAYGNILETKTPKQTDFTKRFSGEEVDAGMEMTTAYGNILETKTPKQTNITKRFSDAGMEMTTTYGNILETKTPKQTDITKRFSGEVDAGMEMTTAYGNILETKTPKQTNITKRFSGEELDAGMEMTTAYGNILETKTPKQTNITKRFSGEELDAGMEMTTAYGNILETKTPKQPDNTKRFSGEELDAGMEMTTAYGNILETKTPKQTDITKRFSGEEFDAGMEMTTAYGNILDTKTPKQTDFTKQFSGEEIDAGMEMTTAYGNILETKTPKQTDITKRFSGEEIDAGMEMTTAYGNILETKTPKQTDITKRFSGEETDAGMEMTTAYGNILETKTPKQTNITKRFSGEELDAGMEMTTAYGNILETKTPKQTNITKRFSGEELDAGMEMTTAYGNILETKTPKQPDNTKRFSGEELDAGMEMTTAYGNILETKTPKQTDITKRFSGEELDAGMEMTTAYGNILDTKTPKQTDFTKQFSGEEIDAGMEMTTAYGNILETKTPKQTDITKRFSREEIDAGMEMTTAYGNILETKTPKQTDITKRFSGEETDAGMEMTTAYGNILETKTPKQTDITKRFSGEEVDAGMEMTTAHGNILETHAQIQFAESVTSSKKVDETNKPNSDNNMEDETDSQTRLQRNSKTRISIDPSLHRPDKIARLVGPTRHCSNLQHLQRKVKELQTLNQKKEVSQKLTTSSASIFVPQKPPSVTELLKGLGSSLDDSDLTLSSPVHSATSGNKSLLKVQSVLSNIHPSEPEEDVQKTTGSSILNLSQKRNCPEGSSPTEELQDKRPKLDIIQHQLEKYAQNEGIQEQNQAVLLNQSLGAQSQTASVQNQAEPLQNQAASLQSQGEPVQNQAESLQTQGEPVQNQAESLQTQGEPVQNLAESLQTQVEPVQTQAKSLQGQSEPIQTQAKSLQSQATSLQSPAMSEQAIVQNQSQQAQALQQDCNTLNESLLDASETGIPLAMELALQEAGFEDPPPDRSSLALTNEETDAVPHYLMLSTHELPDISLPSIPTKILENSMVHPQSDKTCPIESRSHEDDSKKPTPEYADTLMEDYAAKQLQINRDNQPKQDTEHPFSSPLPSNMIEVSKVGLAEVTDVEQMDHNSGSSSSIHKKGLPGEEDSFVENIEDEISPFTHTAPDMSQSTLSSRCNNTSYLSLSKSFSILSQVSQGASAETADQFLQLVGIRPLIDWSDVGRRSSCVQLQKNKADLSLAEILENVLIEECQKTEVQTACEEMSQRKNEISKDMMEIESEISEKQPSIFQSIVQSTQQYHEIKQKSEACWSACRKKAKDLAKQRRLRWMQRETQHLQVNHERIEAAVSEMEELSTKIDVKIKNSAEDIEQMEAELGALDILPGQENDEDEINTINNNIEQRKLDLTKAEEELSAIKSEMCRLNEERQTLSEELSDIHEGQSSTNDGPNEETLKEKRCQFTRRKSLTEWTLVAGSELSMSFLFLYGWIKLDVEFYRDETVSSHRLIDCISVKSAVKENSSKSLLLAYNLVMKSLTVEFLESYKTDGDIPRLLRDVSEMVWRAKWYEEQIKLIPFRQKAEVNGTSLTVLFTNLCKRVRCEVTFDLSCEVTHPTPADVSINTIMGDVDELTVLDAVGSAMSMKQSLSSLIWTLDTIVAEGDTQSIWRQLRKENCFL